MAPFLHGGFGHLIANTVPFMLLAFLIMLTVSMRVVADPAGGAVIAGTRAVTVETGFAARVDRDGNLTAYYETSQDLPVADRPFYFPMVAVCGGSIVVGYNALPGNPDTLQVETVELGCIDGQ